MWPDQESGDRTTRRGHLAAEGLRQAFASFDRRRAYEWKLNLAIWTAIATFLALVVKGKVDGRLSKHWWLVMVAIILIALLHLALLLFMRSANAIDKRKASAYETRVAEAAHVKLESCPRGAWGMMGYPPVIFEWLITLVLLLAAGSAVLNYPIISTAETGEKQKQIPGTPEPASVDRPATEADHVPMSNPEKSPSS